MFQVSGCSLNYPCSIVTSYSCGHSKSTNLVIDFSRLPKYPETLRNSVNLLREYFRTHLHEPICLGGPFEVFYTPKYWRGPKQFAKISKNTPIDSFLNSTSDSVRISAKIIHTRPTKIVEIWIFLGHLSPWQSLRFIRSRPNPWFQAKCNLSQPKTQGSNQKVIQRAPKVAWRTLYMP